MSAIPITQLNSSLLADGFQFLEPGAIASIVLAGLGYLAFQAGLTRSKLMAAVGVLLLVGSGVLSAVGLHHDLESSLLLIFGGLAFGGALVLITFREPVHATLGFSTAILSACGLFFLQSAAFLGAATMIVYAGAIIIVFMFVLMFAQASHVTVADLKITSPVLAAIAGVSLLILILSVLFSPDALPPPERTATQNPKLGLVVEHHDRIAELGRSMYTDYLWSVEIAGTLLLVAMVGAIAIAQTRAGEYE